MSREIVAPSRGVLLLNGDPVSRVEYPSPATRAALDALRAAKAARS